MKLTTWTLVGKFVSKLSKEDWKYYGNVIPIFLLYNNLNLVRNGEKWKGNLVLKEKEIKNSQSLSSNEVLFLLTDLALPYPRSRIPEWQFTHQSLEQHRWYTQTESAWTHRHTVWWCPTWRLVTLVPGIAELMEGTSKLRHIISKLQVS